MKIEIEDANNYIAEVLQSIFSDLKEAKHWCDTDSLAYDYINIAKTKVEMLTNLLKESDK